MKNKNNDIIYENISELVEDGLIISKKVITESFNVLIEIANDKMEKIDSETKELYKQSLINLLELAYSHGVLENKYNIEV